MPVINAARWFPFGFRVSTVDIIEFYSPIVCPGGDTNPFHFQVTTLGKLFTHMRLPHQAV